MSLTCYLERVCEPIAQPDQTRRTSRSKYLESSAPACAVIARSISSQPIYCMSDSHAPPSSWMRFDCGPSSHSSCEEERYLMKPLSPGPPSSYASRSRESKPLAVGKKREVEFLCTHLRGQLAQRSHFELRYEAIHGLVAFIFNMDSTLVQPVQPQI
jgi:hypothetical protein